MLKFKDAIKKSFEYFDEMYDGQNLLNKLLEEIEYDEKEDIWKVVIGFDSNRIEKTTVENNVFAPSTVTKKNVRNYKQIRIKGVDGSFVKMLDQML